jgi:hypothetical protein
MRRLQVLMDERELKEIRKQAESQHLTVAEWVRAATRAAQRAQPSGNTEKKLAALRLALQGTAPTADIEQMQAEIESGYQIERMPMPKAADEP